MADGKFSITCSGWIAKSLKNSMMMFVTTETKMHLCELNFIVSLILVEAKIIRLSTIQPILIFLALSDFLIIIIIILTDISKFLTIL